MYFLGDEGKKTSSSNSSHQMKLSNTNLGCFIVKIVIIETFLSLSLFSGEFLSFLKPRDLKLNKMNLYTKIIFVVNLRLAIYSCRVLHFNHLSFNSTSLSRLQNKFEPAYIFLVILMIVKMMSSHA